MSVYIPHPLLSYIAKGQIPGRMYRHPGPPDPSQVCRGFAARRAVARRRREEAAALCIQAMFMAWRLDGVRVATRADLALRCIVSAGTRPAAAATASGVCSPPPHLCWGRGGLNPASLHRDWGNPGHICTRTGAHPAHICTGTGPTPPTSAPGLGLTRPHLRPHAAAVRTRARSLPRRCAGLASCMCAAGRRTTHGRGGHAAGTR